MMSTVSGAITAGAARGKSTLLRRPNVRRLIQMPILDWVIPPLLVVIILVASAWVAFGPE
jgi:hypothetical protein